MVFHVILELGRLRQECPCKRLQMMSSEQVLGYRMRLCLRKAAEKREKQLKLCLNAIECKRK